MKHITKPKSIRFRPVNPEKPQGTINQNQLVLTFNNVRIVLVQEDVEKIKELLNENHS